MVHIAAEHMLLGTESRVNNGKTHGEMFCSHELKRETEGATRVRVCALLRFIVCVYIRCFFFCLCHIWLLWRSFVYNIKCQMISRVIALTEMNG